jgi:hypothetical protein
LLILLAIGLTGLGLVAAQVASAHYGQASITCSSVTFLYTSFSDGGENTVSEAVMVDGAVVYAEAFTFDGSNGTHTVGIAVPQNGEEHVIEVGAKWSTNGHQGSFSDSARLVCGEKPSPPPPPPAEEPPGPPYVCPDGMPPDAGKDGQAGNDDCDHTQPPPEAETVPPATPPLDRLQTPPAPGETTPAPTETTPAPTETTPAPAETTPPEVETERPAIVGKPPVSEEKAATKPQKNGKAKAVAAQPDTAPQAAPFTP